MSKKMELKVVSGMANSKSLAPAITDPKELIETIAADMGLIPKRGDVMVYVNNGIMKPYITKTGYNRIANAQKISTKIDIIETKHNPNYALVKCTAIRPDGVSHEEFGECNQSERGKEHKPFAQILAMAITRARNRALNVATATMNCSFEEFSDDDEIKKNAIDITDLQEEKLFQCPECHEKGWSKVQKKCVKCGVTYEEILEAKSDE